MNYFEDSPPPSSVHRSIYSQGTELRVGKLSGLELQGLLMDSFGLLWILRDLPDLEAAFPQGQERQTSFPTGQGGRISVRNSLLSFPHKNSFPIALNIEGNKWAGESKD